MRRISRWLAGWGVAAVLLAGGSGCTLPSLNAPGGRLRVISPAGQGVDAQFNFATGYYSYDDANTLTAVLFDGPEEQPRAALTVRMFWQPRAARTPIDPSATNATLHLVIFSESDPSAVAIFSGAGFLYPYDEPGTAQLQGGVWEANLRLADASESYNDPFGQALIEGRFTAQFDRAATERHLHHLRVLVHERLGRPRFVMHVNRE